MSFQDLDFKSTRVHRNHLCRNVMFKPKTLSAIKGDPGKLLSSFQRWLFWWASAPPTGNPRQSRGFYPQVSSDYTTRLRYCPRRQRSIAGMDRPLRPSRSTSPEPEPEDPLGQGRYQVRRHAGIDFDKQGISSKTVHQIATLNEQTKNLRYIKPGQTIELQLNDERQLRTIQIHPGYHPHAGGPAQREAGLQSEIINFQLDAFPAYREGVIKTSLFEAAAEANIPEDVIMDMAAIFLAGTSISRWISARATGSPSSTNELYKDGQSRFATDACISPPSSSTNGQDATAPVYYTDPKGNTLSSTYFDYARRQEHAQGFPAQPGLTVKPLS